MYRIQRGLSNKEKNSTQKGEFNEFKVLLSDDKE